MRKLTQIDALLIIFAPFMALAIFQSGLLLGHQPTVDEGCACEFLREPIDCRQLSAEAARSHDFAAAVAGNSMGEFCERYGYGEIELAAKDQMDLYRQVARRVAVTPAPPIKPWVFSNVPELQAEAVKNGWTGRWPYKGYWDNGDPYWRDKPIPQAEPIK